MKMTTGTNIIGESAERAFPFWFRAWNMEHGERVRIADKRRRRRTLREDDGAEGEDE